MTDVSASADQTRGMMKEALARLRKASSDYFELLEKGLASSPLPMAGQAKRVCGFMQDNVTATFDLGNKLIEAKDMQDAMKVQSEFFQQQMKTMGEQARSVGEAAMKAATGAFTTKN